LPTPNSDIDGVHRHHRARIIAAEAPNPIVNDLVIMPDIEKRLEAFTRVGHGIVIFRWRGTARSSCICSACSRILTTWKSRIR